VFHHQMQVMLYLMHNLAIYNVAPGIVVVPLQQVGGLAPFYCTDGGGSLQIPFNVAALPGETGYAWACIGANFGTALRTFRKL
jgi:hypothetical protein